MKKKILFILLVFLMLGTVAFFYIHSVLLPTKVKSFIQEKAQDYLQRKIAIETIDFEVFRGFTLTNIKIYKKDSDELFFFADEARFSILFAALFRQKALLIPSLVVVKPSFHLIRHKDKSWNILNILNSTRRGQQNAHKLIIGKIVLEDGTLDYTDENAKTHFFDSYENIKFLAKINLERNITFQLSGISKIKDTQLAARGTYELGQKSLRLESMFKNFPLHEYVPLYWENPGIELSKLPLSSKSLILEYQKPSLKITGQLVCKEVSLRLNSLEYNGHFVLENARLKHENAAMDFKGAAVADGTVDFLKQNISQSAKTRLDISSLKWENGLLTTALNARFENFKITSDQNSFQCPSLEMSSVDIAQGVDFSLSFLQADCGAAVLNAPRIFNLKSAVSVGKTNLKTAGDKTVVSSALSLEGADISTVSNNKITTDLSASSISMQTDGETSFVNARLDLSNALIELDKSRSFEGNPKLSLRLDFMENNLNNYKGEVVFTNAKLTGFYKIDVIENIRGAVNFNNETFSSDTVAFKARHTDFIAQGTLDALKEPTGNITLKTEKMDLALLNELFPELHERYHAKTFGLAAFEAGYNGPLLSPSVKNLKFTSTLNLAGIKISEPGLDIKDMSGSLNLKEDILSWQNLTLTLNETPLSLDGNLALYKYPKVTTDIATKDIKAKASLTFMDKSVSLDSLKGRYSFTQFDAAGRLDFGGPADVSVKGIANLEDLNRLPENIYTVLAKGSPVGQMNYSGTFTGNYKDWRRAKINLEAVGDSIRLINYPLNNVRLKYSQENGLMTLFNIRANVYEGSLNIDAEGSLKEEKIPFKSLTKLTEMDLTAYRKDKKAKNRHLSGKLASIFAMDGLLLDPASYKGSGQLHISQAYLGELVPQISAAVFTDVSADFTIKNKKIHTDNARIISKTIDLRTLGWVDFDRNINFDITPALKESQLINTGDVKIDPSILLSKAVSIKLTGTLEKPVKQVNTSPTGVLKNTTGVIKDGLGTILGDLF